MSYYPHPLEVTADMDTEDILMDTPNNHLQGVKQATQGPVWGGPEVGRILEAREVEERSKEEERKEVVVERSHRRREMGLRRKRR